nr:hypothetical protein Iba_chr12fCG6600 [Ipomoea batatas]
MCKVWTVRQFPVNGAKYLIVYINIGLSFNSSWNLLHICSLANLGYNYGSIWLHCSLWWFLAICQGFSLSDSCHWMDIKIPYPGKWAFIFLPFISKCAIVYLGSFKAVSTSESIPRALGTYFHLQNRSSLIAVIYVTFCNF